MLCYVRVHFYARFLFSNNQVLPCLLFGSNFFFFLLYSSDFEMLPNQLNWWIQLFRSFLVWMDGFCVVGMFTVLGTAGWMDGSE